MAKQIDVAAEFSELASPSLAGRHAQVVESLGSMIVRGQLAEGAQLNPVELGDEYGVSRSVMREAFRALEARGLVVARPKLGTRVQSHDHWEALHGDVIRWRVTGPRATDQFGELMDLRTGLEPIAARRCAERVTPELLAQLDAACDAMALAVEAGDDAAFTAADIQFHAALWDGAGSLVLSRLVDVVQATLAARAALKLLPDGLDQEAVAAHRRVVDHIRAADASAAERSVRELVKVAAAEVARIVG